MKSPLQEETSSGIRIAAWVKEVEEKKKRDGRYSIYPNIFMTHDAEEKKRWSLEPQGQQHLEGDAGGGEAQIYTREGTVDNV